MPFAMNLRHILLASLLCAASATGHAAPLRIASGFDPQTMDPHALALLYQSRIYTQVYDALLNRDEQFRWSRRWPCRGRRRPDDLALQAAPQRHVPRRWHVHGR